jgi:hypothetical protein
MKEYEASVAATDTIPTKCYQHGGLMRVRGKRNISVNERNVLKFCTVGDFEKLRHPLKATALWNAKQHDGRSICGLPKHSISMYHVILYWSTITCFLHASERSFCSGDTRGTKTPCRRITHTHRHSVISQKTWVRWQASHNPLGNGLSFARLEMRENLIDLLNVPNYRAAEW